MQDQRATHALTAMMSVNINWFSRVSSGGIHRYGYTPIVWPDICMATWPFVGFIVKAQSEIVPKNVTDMSKERRKIGPR